MLAGKKIIFLRKNRLSYFGYNDAEIQLRVISFHHDYNPRNGRPGVDQRRVLEEHIKLSETRWEAGLLARIPDPYRERKRSRSLSLDHHGIGVYLVLNPKDPSISKIMVHSSRCRRHWHSCLDVPRFWSESNRLFDAATGCSNLIVCPFSFSRPFPLDFSPVWSNVSNLEQRASWDSCANGNHSYRAGNPTKTTEYPSRRWVEVRSIIGIKRNWTYLQLFLDQRLRSYAVASWKWMRGALERVV